VYLQKAEKVMKVAVEETRCQMHLDKNMAMTFYVCPYCGGSIDATGKDLCCAKCDEQFPVINGVPHFYKGDMYWGDMPREQMKEILQNASQKGWKEAISEFDNDDTSTVTLLDYTSEEIRTDWSILLPVQKSSKILDIGCGYGSLSASLARISDYVFSTEPVQERCEFTNIRNKQDNLDLLVARSSLPHLPFKDNYFDVIVMNGVLEWTAHTLESNDPFKTQRDILALLSRKLMKDGSLVLGIENRYSYICFRGKTYHGDIPFTPLMPRFLADFVCRLIRKQPYRTRTYGLKGLKKLLLSSGFREVDILVAHPSYQCPKIMFNAEHSNPFLHHVRNLPGKQTLKMKIKIFAVIVLLKLGLYKYFASHYVVMAKK